MERVKMIGLNRMSRFSRYHSSLGSPGFHS